MFLHWKKQISYFVKQEYGIICSFFFLKWTENNKAKVLGCVRISSVNSQNTWQKCHPLLLEQFIFTPAHLPPPRQYITKTDTLLNIYARPWPYHP